jgi:hypothetical protein
MDFQVMQQTSEQPWPRQVPVPELAAAWLLRVTANIAA